MSGTYPTFNPDLKFITGNKTKKDSSNLFRWGIFKCKKMTRGVKIYFEENKSVNV